MNVGRVARVLGLLLVVAAVVPFVVYGVPEVVGGEQSFVVLTGSMQPSINPGDAVVVESVAPAAVVSGDVITFSRGGESIPTTHRVVEVEQTADSVRYWTKGDNNEDPDPQPVTPDRLVGRVMLTIPYVGFAVQFVNTDVGFAALVVAPIALFVLNEAWLVAASVRGRGRSAEGDADAVTTEPVVVTDAVDDSEPLESAESVESLDSAESPTSSTSPNSPESSAGTTTAATATEPEVAGDDPVADASSGYSVSRSELRIGIVALAAFTVYSVWVATQLTEGWSVAVVAGTAASTLLLCGLYYAAGPSGDDEPSPTADPTLESSPAGQGLTDGGTEPVETAATEDFWEGDDADV